MVRLIVLLSALILVSPSLWAGACANINRYRGVFNFPENRELLTILMKIRMNKDNPVDITYDITQKMKAAGYHFEIMSLNEKATEMAVRIYRLPDSMHVDESFAELIFQNLSMIYFAHDPARAARAWEDQTDNPVLKSKLGSREFLPLSLLVLGLSERPEFMIALLKSPLMFKNMIEGKEVPLAIRSDVHGKDDWMFELMNMVDLIDQRNGLQHKTRIDLLEQDQTNVQKQEVQTRLSEAQQFKSELSDLVDQDKVSFYIDPLSKSIVAYFSVPNIDGRLRSAVIYLPKARATNIRSYNLFVLRAYLAKVGQDLRDLQAKLDH